jgi:osmotically-inducible protein OsmY
MQSTCGRCPTVSPAKACTDKLHRGFVLGVDAMAAETPCSRQIAGQLSIAVVAALLILPSPAGADETAAPAVVKIAPIIVTGKKAEDLKMEQAVQTALHLHPVVYDKHITVTVENGVATLTGFVFDDWDRWLAYRVSLRIPGVKRVINDLEVVTPGSDG